MKFPLTGFCIEIILQYYGKFRTNCSRELLFVTLFWHTMYQARDLRTEWKKEAHYFSDLVSNPRPPIGAVVLSALVDGDKSLNTFLTRTVGYLHRLLYAGITIFREKAHFCFYIFSFIIAFSFRFEHWLAKDNIDIIHEARYNWNVIKRTVHEEEIYTCR